MTHLDMLDLDLVPIPERITRLAKELADLKERLKHLESIGLIPKEKKPDKIEE